MKNKSKARVERQPAIDIRVLNRQRGFKEGSWVHFGITRNHCDLTKISMRRDTQGVIHWQRQNGVIHSQIHCIEVVNTSCHFGGERTWFVCPGCCRTVAILYYLHREFSCRNCNDLNYLSQQATALDWKMARSDRLRSKLGMGSMFTHRLSSATRPKYMRYATYIEYLGKLHLLECEILADLSRGIN